MILAMEAYFRSADLSSFATVERWTFEDLAADLPGHLRALGLDTPRITDQRGVPHGQGTVLNMDEVHGWAEALAADGLRIRRADEATCAPCPPP